MNLINSDNYDNKIKFDKLYNYNYNYYNLLRREMKRERGLVSLSGEGREFQ